MVRAIHKCTTEVKIASGNQATEAQSTGDNTGRTIITAAGAEIAGARDKTEHMSNKLDQLKAERSTSNVQPITWDNNNKPR